LYNGGKIGMKRGGKGRKREEKNQAHAKGRFARKKKYVWKKLLLQHLTALEELKMKNQSIINED